MLSTLIRVPVGSGSLVMKITRTELVGMLFRELIKPA